MADLPLAGCPQPRADRTSIAPPQRMAFPPADQHTYEDRRPAQRENRQMAGPSFGAWAVSESLPEHGRWGVQILVEWGLLANIWTRHCLPDLHLVELMRVSVWGGGSSAGSRAQGVGKTDPTSKRGGRRRIWPESASQSSDVHECVCATGASSCAGVGFCSPEGIRPLIRAQIRTL